MRKLIAAINITIDGFCDHTAVIADDELHENASALLRSADVMLSGRNTYELMKAGWSPLVKNPSGVKAMDDFAIVIENIPKIVFSKTLKSVEWKNSTLAGKGLRETVVELKQQSGKNILVGSPSLIVQLTELRLIDEYQLCVQPIVLGKGLVLFNNISKRIDLKLISSKVLASGAVTHYYE